MKTNHLEEVTVIPSRTAGGSMASYAYKNFENALVVENINADAGIDIGETMIGMQLKKVAVPLRFNQKSIGNAHLNGARTRPKLIGGRSEEHTSELQSRGHLVCRLLLGKNKGIVEGDRNAIDC